MQRWLVGSCFLLFGFGLNDSMMVTPVRAQEAAAPAAEAAAAPAAGAADKPAATSEHKPPSSKLMWIIVTSGWIGAFLMVLSIYFIATSGRLRGHHASAPASLPDFALMMAARSQRHRLLGQLPNPIFRGEMRCVKW